MITGEPRTPGRYNDDHLGHRLDLDGNDITDAALPFRHPPDANDLCFRVLAAQMSQRIGWYQGSAAAMPCRRQWISLLKELRDEPEVDCRFCPRLGRTDGLWL
jgi:hypothetical protein